MNEKILAVDDDPMIHKLLEFSLKDEDYTIDSKLSGNEAQEYLKEEYDNISALILDWEMPGISGLDLLKWLKENEQYKDIPVVMLTSHSDKADVQKGIEAGAYYYLTKPFNKDVLKSIIRVAISDYLNLKQLNQQIKKAQNPFDNLVTGTFKIRTLDEAQRLSVYIANASASPEETLIICELLNNAIEHGNLGITYDEKSKLIDEDRLFSEIEKRLSIPENLEKYTVVEFLYENEHIKVNVQDQGDGFEFQKYLKFDEARVFDNHGRGIAMANSVLDIQYKGKGNEVEVSIPLSKNQTHG